MKVVTRRNKGFAYEYESTRKRKFYNVLENVVNYALLLTFSGSILFAVVLTFVNLV